MPAYTQDSIELLAQLHAHGAITMDEFKDSFPKEQDPSRRLHKMVHSGLLRRVDGTFSVTDKGRELLASKDRAVPVVAGPRRIEHGGTYTGQRFAPMRPGADDHLRIPSLMGGVRIYRKDANA